MRHLLSVEDLTRADIERLCDRATSFAEVAQREIKKVPALRGRTVLNLFYEASTRTRSSFELAAKRLGLSSRAWRRASGERLGGSWSSRGILAPSTRMGMTRTLRVKAASISSRTKP